VSFEDLGEQALKNIDRPVRAYRVRSGIDRATDPPFRDTSPSLVLPDKPSIAVLPFANMSAEPEQEFVADGIAEDIITALSRYSSLFVIARNSCFTYKGKSVDVREVGRELGVRYVLEGSLRKTGNRARISAQLIEASTSKHVWAEPYDRDLADIFTVQDEITEAVTMAIVPAIAEAEQQRAMRKPPGSLDAWATYQRGLWHLGRFSPADNALAQTFFQQAINLDSNFSSGYTGLSWAQDLAATVFRTIDFDQGLNTAETLAHRAIALDSSEAEAYSCLALLSVVRGDHESGLTQAGRALEISPNLASAYGGRGFALAFGGQPKNGLIALNRSMRLDPRDPFFPIRLLHVACCHYFCEEYEAAAETAKRAVRAFPQFPMPYRWLAASLGQLGRREEATEVGRQAANLPVASFRAQRSKAMRPVDFAHFADGLQKAGWVH
jgi:adenylate cyclase